MMVVIISLRFCKFIIRKDGTDWSNEFDLSWYKSVQQSGLAGVICEKCVLACKLVRLLFSSLVAGIVFSLFSNCLLRISK